MEFVLNIGIVLSFFLGILLFSKKDKVFTDNILSMWLFVIGIHLAGYFFYFKGYWETYPHLIGITAPLPFIYGPFLYLYVTHSIKKERNLSLRDYFHFIPLLVSYLYMMPFYFLYSAEEKIQVDNGLIDDYGVFSYLLVIGIIISGVIYSILAFRSLQKRKRILTNNFSYNDRIDMKWLQSAIFGIISFFLIAGIVSILREIIGFEFPFNADILFYSIIISFVVFIGYSGIRQRDLFSNSVLKEEDLVKRESEYKRSSLKPEDAFKIHIELQELMTKTKPYLNPKLTIRELAHSLAISTNHLSQVINQNEKVNFHDFVNKYRVEEFIQRAKNNDTYSLLSLAYDSGFNSKSTFNSVFKKLKSTTPSQYLASLKT